MFKVFRAYGPHSHLSYYGYSSEDDVLEGFLTGGTRSENNRADVKLVKSNGDDPKCIRVDILEEFDEEVDAFIERNNLRVKEHDSISGPTQFPGKMAERALEKHPELQDEWSAKLKIKNSKTAREAYSLGLWTKDQVMNLANVFDKKLVVLDLDKLSPSEFQLKYSTHLEGS